MLKTLVLGRVVSGAFVGTIAAGQARDYMAWGYTFTTENETTPTVAVAPAQPSNFNALAAQGQHPMRLRRLHNFERR